MNIAPLAAYGCGRGIFLKKQFEIFMHSQPVGSATVQKDGLYFSFSCSCQMPDNGIYRVVVEDGKHSENLGVLIPNGDTYALTAKLPLKRFCTDNFSFQVMDRQKKASGICVPLASDKPFLYISKLRESYLTLVDGQLYIRLPDICNQISSSKPTGQ